MKLISLTFVAMAGLAGARPSLAADATPDPRRAAAAEHFARGLHLFENQDDEGALVELRRAYELIPSPAVLYNIGLVSASLGDAVGAVAALGTVLESPAALKPAQLERARRVKGEQEQRVAWLRVTTNVPADLEIDGRPAGRAPQPEPIRVTAGARVVTATADGHAPARQEVSVAAGARSDVDLVLRPTEAPLARVTVATSVPGAEVLVDGTFAGRTPLPASLPVEPGARVLELRRPGYLTETRTVTLAAGEQAKVNVELRPEPGLPPAQHGRVVVRSDQASQLRWSVDGHHLGAYRGGILLPPGPHRLRLERPGFEPLDRTVVVAPGSEHAISAELRPTEETRRAQLSRVGTYRFLAVSALAAGVGLAAGGGGYIYWSDGKLDNANAALSNVEADRRWGGGGSCDPSSSWFQAETCSQRLAAARDDVSHYRDLRTMGIVVTSVGAALAVTGVVLLLAGDDPKRWEDKDADLLASSPSITWQPVFTAGPSGGGLGLAGRF